MNLENETTSYIRNSLNTIHFANFENDLGNHVSASGLQTGPCEFGDYKYKGN